MLEILKIILIGIVEGFTEWLPISSTGHMILLEEFVKLDVRPEFWSIFLVVIQLGAILAVVCIYFHKLNPFSQTKSKDSKKNIWQTWFKVIVGCIPAGILGVLLNDFMDEHLMTWPVVAFTLIFYGILFILVEKRNENRTPTVNEMSELSYKKAFCIGCFQALSLVPGTSRSGASILGATYLGTSRSIAADFSFSMSIPIMFAASFLKITKAVMNGFSFQGIEIMMLGVGISIAFIVSFLTIKFLLQYIKHNDFKIFGWYRIILGVIVTLFFLFH